MQRWLVALSLAVAAFAPAKLFADDAEVTVIAILANDRDQFVDPKLKGIAGLLKQKVPSLTSFKLATQTNKTITLNKKESFPLVDDLAAEVSVISGNAEKKEAKVSVKAPHSSQVEYTIKGEKYFPIETRYQNKDKDRMFFAIMVKPLPPKPADKEKDKQ